MKKVWNSICMSFSMFSVFPAPNAEWNRENMKYMLCALPLVGCVIGAMMVICDRLSGLLALDNVLRAALLTALPVVLSGGIHLDGFCDTADALASHASPERKREIMKDSRAGAFAVIAFGIYILLYFAACGSVGESMVLFIIPVLSRSVGAFGGMVLRGSNSTGLLSDFRDGAARASDIILFVWICLCFAGAALIHPIYSAALIFAAVLCFFATGRLAEKQFGGMTGDLAGYMNAMTELTALLFCALAEKIGGAV